MIVSDKGTVIIKGDHENITADFCAILIGLIQKGCTPAITTSLGVVIDNDVKELAEDDKNN